MILAILQARLSSSRLPGKVLLPLAGAPMILRQVERVRRAARIDRLVVATSDQPSDDRLADTLAEAGVETYRGPLDDVLARFIGALDAWPADHVVRLTGDCPLVDPGLPALFFASFCLLSLPNPRNPSWPPFFKTFPPARKSALPSQAAWTPAQPCSG